MRLLKDYNKTALIYDNQEISYEKFLNYVFSYTHRIDGLKGEKIGIYTVNRPELAYSIFATWQSGATPVTIDASSSVDELVYVFKDSKPKAIFTTADKREIVEEAIEKSSLDIQILIFEELEYSEFNKEIREPDANEEALILYTSGTTGDPKGVVLTFKNLYFQINSLNKFNMYEEQDVYLALLPLHHIFPLMGSLIVPLINGGTIVFLKELNGEAITNALAKYKVTFLCGVPRLYELLYKGVMKKVEASKLALTIFNIAKHIKSEKIKKKLFKKVQDGFGGHIKFLVSGGAKLDEDIAKAFDTFGFKVIEGYGLTETSPMISFTRPNSIVLGSAGTILDGLDVKLNEDGVLCVKGDNVFKEYLNKEELTKDAFDSEGYFVTGDLANIGADRRLHITGRKKEMIVLSNGKNINPAEIEEQLLNLADGLIEELAVIDFNNTLNLVVKPNLKTVELKKISNILETIKWDIVDKYNSKAPKYRKILNIKLIKGELPKTKLGKLRRFKVRDILAGKEEEKRQVVEPIFPEYQEIKKYLYETCKKDIYPDSHIEVDLGFDSLDIVELFAHINTRYTIDMTEEVFSKNSSVEALAKYIKEHKGEGLNHAGKLIEEGRTYDLPKSSWFMLFLKGLFLLPFRIFFSLSITGREHLSDKATIYIGNHTSVMDAFILSQALPNDTLKNSYFMAKVKHFKGGMMKFLGNNSNVIIIDINENLKETLNKCAYALRKGRSIVIFPEGIRSRDGQLNEFKKSFAHLANELDIDVVPFVIKGAYDAMPHGSHIPKPNRIDIEFLPKLSKKGVDELVVEAQDAIGNRLR